MKRNIFYLRDEKNFPVACIASIKPDSPSSRHIPFAIAIHNPNDPFSRDFARRVADARLDKDITTTAFVTKDEHPKHAVLRTIAVGEIRLKNSVWGYAPQRIREAAHYRMKLFEAEALVRTMAAANEAARELLPPGLEVPLSQSIAEKIEKLAEEPTEASIQMEEAIATFVAHTEPQNPADIDVFTTPTMPEHHEHERASGEGMPEWEPPEAHVPSTPPDEVHVGTTEGEVVITADPATQNVLDRIFTGVHSRPEQPWSWNDAPRG